MAPGGKSAYFMKGKGKGKSKGKFKGKGKGKGKSKSANAMWDWDPQSQFAGAIEMVMTTEMLAGTSTAEAVATEQPDAINEDGAFGMLDCGATASAGSEQAVQRLVAAVLRADPRAQIKITNEESARPYFRFGSGAWGRALCRCSITSHISGHDRRFSVFVLPTVAGSKVPILVGMDHIETNGSH